jgi:uncharacterized repeat protein (TIGR01451 family)
MNRNFLRTCTTIAALGLLASCNDRATTAPSAISLAPTDPSFAAGVPFNDEGVCLAADAFRSGFTSGVNSENSLLADPTKSCTSNDVRVAQADIISFSFDGVDFTTYTGQEVTCAVDQPIFVKVAAHLEETATSARSDIGIYIGLNGSNGRTGTCNHYNLVAPAQGTTVGGVTNIDGDKCGDMNAGGTTNPPVELGIIDAICQSTGGSDLLHIGSCLTWTVPGSDQVCPQGDVESPNGFRWGTAPSAKSKCNCAGFDLPITVVRTPNVALTKTADAASVSAGSQIGFTVTVANTGPAAATDLVVTDTLPGGTGVSWSIETNPVPTGWALVTGGNGRQILTFTSSSFAIGSTSVHVISSTTSGSCKQYDNTARATASNQTSITPATASTTVNCPSLSLVKKPDTQADPGYTVSSGDSARFTITVTNSSATGTGTATGVVLTDTLPAGLTWVANNTTTCPSPMGTWADADAKSHQILVCNIGTLAPGGSFEVKVAALVPNGFTQNPPSSVANPIEIDGNLLDGAAAGKDWANVGINCIANPKVGCDIDLPTGTGDNAFGQGTKEDTPIPTIVFGSIPNNKSDLLRFYVANERVVSNDFLYLAWERVQAPNGTTNMDFELNQSNQLSANGVTPVRTADDILVMFDLERGGTNPTLSFSRWMTSGSPATVCEASNSLPCWGKRTSILTGATADINDDAAVSDPILAAGQVSARTLDKLTFGEASIDLQTTGIFTAGACVSFGQAYLKSRSSDSFASELKDFIAPIPISVTNCAPVTIFNTAYVTGDNVSSLSDTGQIKVE